MWNFCALLKSLVIEYNCINLKSLFIEKEKIVVRNVYIEFCMYIWNINKQGYTASFRKPKIYCKQNVFLQNIIITVYHLCIFFMTVLKNRIGSSFFCRNVILKPYKRRTKKKNMTLCWKLWFLFNLVSAFNINTMHIVYC